MSIDPVEWPGPKSTSCLNLLSLAPGEVADATCTVRTDSEATCAPMVTVGVWLAYGETAVETWRNLPADVAGLAPCEGSPDPAATDTAVSEPIAQPAGLAPLLNAGWMPRPSSRFMPTPRIVNPERQMGIDASVALQLTAATT